MSASRTIDFTRAGVVRGARMAAPLIIGSFRFGLMVGAHPRPALSTAMGIANNADRG